jgi:hypothetical protein
MLRDKATWRESARITWALWWRVWWLAPLLRLVYQNASSPSELIQPIIQDRLLFISAFVGMALDAGVILLLIGTVILWTSAVVRYLIGRQLNTISLVVQLIKPENTGADTCRRTASFSEAFRVAVEVIVRGLLIQAILALYFIPFSFPLLCVVPGLWFGLCNTVSQSPFFLKMMVLNAEYNFWPSLLIIQVFWIPAVRLVIGRQLGRFRVVLDDPAKIISRS